MFEDFGRYEFVGASKLRMPYRLLAPRELSSDAKYRLVILFHGSGERGDDNEKQLLNGAVRFDRPESRSQHPGFVLVPQCPTHLDKQPTMWTGTREEMHQC